MKLFYLLILFLGFYLLISSCKKAPEYPDKPQIKYLNHIVTDSTDKLGNPYGKNVQLIFSLIDGNGDIGSYDDTTHNLFTTIYVKKNGVFSVNQKEVTFILPYIKQPGGTYKTIKATVTVSWNYYKPFFPYDTLKYEFYFEDRAKNRSNTETTPEVILNWK